MAAFTSLLGDSVVTKQGTVGTAEALGSAKAVALYFSAHWCPPCRAFTPKFAKWYSENLKSKGLEVVFVSSDRDEEGFKEYYEEQPWMACVFDDRDRKDAISKKFKIRGIPAVVLLDADANIITKDGRDMITSDPKGEDFPWIPKPLSEVMAGAKIIDGAGAVFGPEALAGKVYGLYFSAHWCPPCRSFTPKLAEWYTKDLKAKGFEILFVSSDRDEGSFKTYFGEMPWLALDFADRMRKEQLSSLFGVKGIPSFVLVDSDGSVITKEGRDAVSSDPAGANFPWYPKPVRNLAQGPGSINDVPTVFAFCETCDNATQEAVEAAMEPIAKRYHAEAKAAGEEEPSVAFTIATSSGGLTGRLRGMLSLEELPPPAHEHPLEKKEAGGGWGCDGCGCDGSPSVERFRCTEGCDFDYCGECHGKVGTSKTLPAKLMLVDIPDEGGYYEGPEGDITAETVEKFVADYLEKSLTRKQLG
eukprot:TRINITY_DN2468_c0_g1_i1.p1 TRINITY_DN2468_c0_g1~~TRINITY_DN2468_c0_g1_i1.p1  ORF type:complete len:473 (+),score=93.50 TRINITY_DN2468_c0_g1_i1:86-1504(+)